MYKAAALPLLNPAPACRGGKEDQKSTQINDRVRITSVTDGLGDKDLSGWENHT